MNKLENNLIEELCLVQIAFAQTVVKQHKERSPDSLEHIAKNWIVNSELWDKRERLAGLYALINFFKLKRTYVSRCELEILEEEARKLESEGVKILEAFFCKRFYLTNMMKLAQYRYRCDNLTANIGAPIPNLHCVSRGAYRDIGSFKKLWTSVFSGVKKWL